MPWRPNQQRQLELESPYEDLPPHLRDHVLAWIQSVLGASIELTRKVALKRRVVVPDVGGSHVSAVRHVMFDAQTEETGAAALDLVETLLSCESVNAAYISQLNGFLRDGHSAYAVREDLLGLEMRNLPEVKEQVQVVVDAAEESAGEHLAAAWNASNGRTPDPEKAYDRSIKAVESALRSVISPATRRPPSPR